MEYSAWSPEIIDIAHRLQEKIESDILSLRSVHEQLFETFFFDPWVSWSRIFKMKKLAFQIHMNEHAYWKKIEHILHVSIEEMCKVLEKKEGFTRKKEIKKEYLIQEILMHIWIESWSLYSTVYHNRYCYDDFLMRIMETDGKKSLNHFSYFYEILLNAYGDESVIIPAHNIMQWLRKRIQEQTGAFLLQRKWYVKAMKQLDRMTQSDIILYETLEEILAYRDL